MATTSMVEGRFVIPKADIGFFKTLATKMGWMIKTKDIDQDISIMEDIELGLYQAKDMSEGKEPRTEK